jgi:hypothetical protein
MAFQRSTARASKYLHHPGAQQVAITKDDTHCRVLFCPRQLPFSHRPCQSPHMAAHEVGQRFQDAGGPVNPLTYVLLGLGGGGSR